MGIKTNCSEKMIDNHFMDYSSAEENVHFHRMWAHFAICHNTAE